MQCVLRWQWRGEKNETITDRISNTQRCIILTVRFLAVVSWFVAVAVHDGEHLECALFFFFF